jgi:O-antigen/teichoic acid export membrane protein
MQVAGTRASIARPSRLVAGGVAVVVGTGAFQLANFLTNAVAARALGPDSYADLAAVIGLVYLSSPFFVSFQTVASRVTTTLIAEGHGRKVRGLLAYYATRVTAVVALIGGVLALGSGLVAAALRIPSAMPIALLSVVFAFSTVTHLQRGVLQGARRFGQFGAGSAIEGWIKLVTIVVLLRVVVASPSVVIVGLIVGGGAAAVIDWSMLRSMPPSEYGVFPEAHPFRLSLHTLGTLLLLAMLLSVDVIAANRYLPDTTAGIYAALSLTAKTVFFATAALTTFAFPLFSEHHDLGRDARPTLLWILAVDVAIVASATVALTAFPNAFLSALFGERFLAAAPYVSFGALVFGLYAIVHVCAMYLLSQGRTAAIVVLGACALAQLAGLRAFHDSIPDLLTVQAVVFATAAVALFALALLARRDRSAREDS